MKRIKHLLLMALCMLLCMATPVLADEEIHFGGESSRNGDKITVTLTADKGGAYSGQFELYYDTAKVTFEKATLGDALKDVQVSSMDTETDSCIKVGFADTTAIKAGDVLVAEFSIAEGASADKIIFPYNVTELSNDVANGLLSKVDGAIGNVVYEEKEDSNEGGNTEDSENDNGGNQSTGIVLNRETKESSYTNEDGTVNRQLTRGTLTITGSEKVLPVGSEILIRELTSGERYDNASDIVKKQLKGVDTFKVFDISLYDMSNTKIIELDAAVEVTMPVPAGMKAENGKTVAVYRVEANGTLTYCTATIKDGMLTFSTDRMGTFVVAQQEASAVKGAKTSDTGMIPLAILVLVLGVAVVAYAGMKARKANR